MAEYGIVLQLVEDIKGNILLKDYKDGIGVTDLSFGFGASRVGGGSNGKNNVSVSPSSIQLTIHAGKWTPEILSASYNSRKFKKVNIFQLAQAVDKTLTATPTVRQKLTLEGAYISSISVPMRGDSDRVAVITLEFDKLLYEHSEKSADLVVRNTAETAV